MGMHEGERFSLRGVSSRVGPSGPVLACLGCKGNDLGGSRCQSAGQCSMYRATLDIIRQRPLAPGSCMVVELAVPTSTLPSHQNGKLAAWPAATAQLDCMAARGLTGSVALMSDS